MGNKLVLLSAARRQKKKSRRTAEDFSRVYLTTVAFEKSKAAVFY